VQVAKNLITEPLLAMEKTGDPFLALATRQMPLERYSCGFITTV
jgi:hypothetical protein